MDKIHVSFIYFLRNTEKICNLAVDQTATMLFSTHSLLLVSKQMPSVVLVCEM